MAHYTRGARGLLALKKPANGKAHDGEAHKNRKAVAACRQLVGANVRRLAERNVNDVIVAGMYRKQFLVRRGIQTGKARRQSGDRRFEQRVLQVRHGFERAAERCNFGDRLGTGSQGMHGSRATGAYVNDVQWFAAASVDIGEQFRHLAFKLQSIVAPSKGANMCLVAKKSPDKSKKRKRAAVVADSGD